VATLQAAGIAVTDAAVRKGLATVEWPGRFQAVGRMILDGAHNAHGAAQLVTTWRETFGDERAVVIFGAMRDKSYADMLGALAPVAAEFWFVPVDSPRAESPERLAATTSGRIYPDLRLAIVAAESREERVLLTGSLFLVGEALEMLGA
jgi:dihydrofolate synthase/folylpolyglutamate synthase